MSQEEIDLTHTKLFWGFFNATDDYFFGSRNPKKFYESVKNSGFSANWLCDERQSAIARLAMRKKFRIMREPEETLKQTVQSFFNTLASVYRSEFFKD